MFRLTFIISLLFFSVISRAEDKGLYFLCKNNNAVRTIRIEKNKGSCVVTYTKSGEEKVVGKSSKMETCLEVLNKIKDNIEKSDWKCKDITESRVSAANPEL